MARNRKDTPVVLSRIYTRTGDGGMTRLGDMSEVAKTDPRLAAYADVDEANCAIGTAIAVGQLDPGVAVLLTRIQNELFDVGADLCKPIAATSRGGGEPGEGGGGAGVGEPPPTCGSPRTTSTAWRPSATGTTRIWRYCAASCSRAGRRAPRCCTPRGR